MYKFVTILYFRNRPILCFENGHRWGIKKMGKKFVALPNWSHCDIARQKTRLDKLIKQIIKIEAIEWLKLNR